MDKVFLLGVSLLCLLGDGEPGLFGPRGDPLLICNVCNRYVYTRCLVNESTCSTSEFMGCRTQVHYQVKNEKWLYSHTSMDCAKNCKRSYRKMHIKAVFTFCCDDKDRCNWPYTPMIRPL